MYEREIDEYVKEYLPSIGRSKSTLDNSRIILNRFKDKTKEEVFEYIRSLEQTKLNNRRVTKSYIRKFAEWIGDNEIIEELSKLSEIEVKNDNAEFFMNALEVNQVIEDLALPKATISRAKILAFLLYIGVEKHSIRTVTIDEFDETKNVITHDKRVYDISVVDTKDIIRSAFITNKYATAIDYETGDYLVTAGGSPLVKSLVGRTFLRTSKTDSEAKRANTKIPTLLREKIAKSGAFKRYYQIKQKLGTDSAYLINCLIGETVSVCNREVTIDEYEAFEKAYEKYLKELNKESEG